MEQTEMRISQEDWEFLKKLNSEGQKYESQQEIIDSLIDLYNLYKPYTKAEDSWKEANKKGSIYFKEKKKNYIIMTLFAAATAGIAYNMWDYGSLMTKLNEKIEVYLQTTLLGAVPGIAGAQYENKKNNYENVLKEKDTREYFQTFCNDLQQKTIIFMEIIIKQTNDCLIG